MKHTPVSRNPSPYQDRKATDPHAANEHTDKEQEPAAGNIRSMGGMPPRNTDTIDGFRKTPNEHNDDPDTKLDEMSRNYRPLHKNPRDVAN